MATLATGLLASFDRTGLAPVGFLQVVSPTSFLVPPLPRFSQRDRSLSEKSSTVHLKPNRKACEFVSHGQDLQNIRARSRFAVTPQAFVTGCRRITWLSFSWLLEL